MYQAPESDRKLWTLNFGYWRFQNVRCKNSKAMVDAKSKKTQTLDIFIL